MTNNKKINQITPKEIQNVTGSRNECGCTNGMKVELHDAPDYAHCRILCCEIEGKKYFQWLNSQPYPCKKNLSDYDPIKLAAGWLLHKLYPLPTSVKPE